jgi:glycosyltransferase involved in cell wall biosynthesis
MEPLAPRLSVVIPIHNGADHLRKCLEALRASTRRPDEIVVVDDSSTDDSAAIARSYDCQLVQLQAGPRGPATARNRGVRATSGDIIAFIDCDVVVHPDALRLMEDQFVAHHDLSAVFGSYDDAPTNRTLVSQYRNLLHHYVHQVSRREASSFWAGCGAIRREAFEAADGFDETYRWASIEDIELGLRLRVAGHRLLLCREIQATHRKQWTLLEVIHTDVFYRAVPWTRLLFSHKHIPSDLNLRWENRVSGIAAWVLVLTAISSPTGPLSVGLAACAIVVLLACNWNLYRLFVQRGGIRFGLGAIALHWLHYLYAAATFIVISVEVFLRSARRFRGSSKQSGILIACADPTKLSATQQ